MAHKKAKIVLKNGRIHLLSKDVCLASGNIRRIGRLCDVTEIEDMEWEAIQSMRKLGREKGFNEFEVVGALTL
jgi:hypothetical protein